MTAVSDFLFFPRSGLASILLKLISLGINNFSSFDLYSKVPVPSLSRALQVSHYTWELHVVNTPQDLYMLNIIDTSGALVHPYASAIAESPLDLPLAYMVLSGNQITIHVLK